MRICRSLTVRRRTTDRHHRGLGRVLGDALAALLVHEDEEPGHRQTHQSLFARHFVTFEVFKSPFPLKERSADRRLGAAAPVERTGRRPAAARKAKPFDREEFRRRFLAICRGPRLPSVIKNVVHVDMYTVNVHNWILIISPGFYYRRGFTPDPFGKNRKHAWLVYWRTWFATSPHTWNFFLCNRSTLPGCFV